MVGEGRMTTIMVVITIFGSFITPDGPYTGSYDEMECGVYESTPCCHYVYIIDRYCCPEEEYNVSCVDDCLDQERAADYKNALRSTETWCMPQLCKWELESYGFQ